jgi:hypothetical protein
MYKARPDRIGRGKKKPRALSFDKDTVVDVGKQFDVIPEIKILSENEQDKTQDEDSEDKTRWDEWTNGQCTSVHISPRNRGIKGIDDSQNKDINDSPEDSKNVEDIPTLGENSDNISNDKQEGECTENSVTPCTDEKFVHLYTNSNDPGDNPDPSKVGARLEQSPAYRGR